MLESGAIAVRFFRVQDTHAFLFASLTIFLGAVLLFAVEPLIAKMILPWFGGSAAVWITCLVFFQGALLAGYFYAHLLTTRLTVSWRLRAHLLLLAISLLFLPIIPAEGWKPTGDEAPLPFILGMLTATIGLPFLLLSSTGPLIQAWVSHGREGAGSRSVYRLYALSNVGSLLALICYPTVVEPWLPTRLQAWSWSLAYCLFVCCSGATLWLYRNAETARMPSREGQGRPGIDSRTIWFLLALLPSALLLAVTNHMLRNVAAIPLLWIVPLSLYLLSFIVAFDNPRWYYRPLWYPLFALASGAMIYFTVGLFPVGRFGVQLAFYAAGLFICCMVCHGELAARKPAPSYLTSFYLLIAAGGAAGGLLIAVLAPLVLNGDYDLALVLPVLALFVLVLGWRQIPAVTPPWLRWNALAGLLYAWAYLTGSMALKAHADVSGSLLQARNFYGPLRVGFRVPNNAKGEIVQLWNGTIIHGREFTAPWDRCEPISYYGPQSGIGLTLRELGKERPLQIGVVGLGAGMIAGYGRPEDAFRFYEINPLVYRIATTSFSYLPSCPAQWSVALGDARLSLEREAPQNFDVLAMDAFTGDAIPVHLLTKEAFALYWRHLKPDGVLAVHVSNRYVDLAPVVALAAAENGKDARLIVNGEDVENAIDGSVWVLVTSRTGFFANLPLAAAKPIAPGNGRLWTDDYSNLWGALK